MITTEIGYIVSKMNEAELVLVGLGEELDLIGQFPVCERSSYLEKNENLLPFVRKIMIEEKKSQFFEVYDNLARCLKEKNYFIVSLCQDGLIKNSRLNQERIVEPCGNYERLQCGKACSDDLYEIPETFLSTLKKELSCKEDVLPGVPKCPHCGNDLVFNNLNAENYLEEGYLDQWAVYKKWLQGTVNKKVCILELGVGMKYPTVIRWPFEKITFFNQKAELFRVHSRLYQITEEIKERGFGICQSPQVFLKELSNEF